MNHCKDCKLWNKGPSNEDLYGWCKGIPHCSDPIPSETRGTLAYTTDAEEYYSELWTLADFGCVLFQPKS